MRSLKVLHELKQSFFFASLSGLMYVAVLGCGNMNPQLELDKPSGQTDQQVGSNGDSQSQGDNSQGQAAGNSNPTQTPAACEPEPTTIQLTAAKEYRPSRWYNAEHSASSSLRFLIPAELTVTKGNAGNQWSTLLLKKEGSNRPILCLYKGGASRQHPTNAVDKQKGLKYKFFFCSNGKRSGDAIMGRFFNLSVANGDDRSGKTEVKLDLGAEAVNESVAACAPPSGGTDTDGDGVYDDDDNCSAIANASQADMDSDGLGDVCDPDIDGDGVDNDADGCPTDSNCQ